MVLLGTGARASERAVVDVACARLTASARVGAVRTEQAGPRIYVGDDVAVAAPSSIGRRPPALPRR